MSHQELIRKSKNIIRELFKEYYKGAELHIPNDFIMREFAFQSFESDAYIRHKSFSSLALLQEYVTNLVPKHAYFSSALYRDPAANNMDEKGWIGSDIIFDIDADELPNCKPLELTACDGSECRDVDLVTNECIEAAKKQEEMLVDVLINDFGFSSEEIEVYFTGNRGFHTRIHPKDPTWLTLSSIHRKEIVDYLKGVELNPAYIIPTQRRGVKPAVPKVTDGGWRGRIARVLLRQNRFISELDIETLRNLIMECSVYIDEKVTIDTSRLVRIVGSLNGKTGLKVKPVDMKDIAEFKLTDSLSPFTKYVTTILPLVDIRNFNLMGYNIDLRRGEVINVPAPVGIYLTLKEVAYILRVT